MKRIGYLYDRIIDLENIKLADKKAQLGKKSQKSIILFNLDRENNLLKIQEELKNKTYKVSEYYIFKLYEPKERIIAQLDYKDRIVQHAIMNIIEPILVDSFISQTYSCLKHRGIHKCLHDVKKSLRDKENTKYVLKLDIKKFYQSIDQNILKVKLRRKFKDEDLLDLLDIIIDSYPQGVPLGNLTSQYFANFYLNSFDHKLKQDSGIKYVMRYADDIVILHKDKFFLKELITNIKDYLDTELKLSLSKYRIFPIKLGIDFVGYKIYPDYILLRKSIKERFIKMINKYPNRKSIMSYYGWIKYCNGINLWNKYVVQNQNIYINTYKTKTMLTNLSIKTNLATAKAIRSYNNQAKASNQIKNSNYKQKKYTFSQKNEFIKIGGVEIF